jgi:hypothetical protein
MKIKACKTMFADPPETEITTKTINKKEKAEEKEKIDEDEENP